MPTKEHHAAWKREWRKKNPEKRRAAAKRHATKHPDVIRAARGRHREMRRAYIVQFFGGECVHCGFTDIRALQMDHINGRKGKTKLDLDGRYQLVKKRPEEARLIYQLLCANCNFIKRVVNKEHFYHGKIPL